MKRILNKGNMPSHIAIFAAELKGQMSGQEESEFWEMDNVDEIEKKAVEIGFELIPAMDSSTQRGYLVGFDVETPKIVQTAQSYAKLKMYFIELTSVEFKTWNTKILQHREDQQQDMRRRQTLAAKKHKRNITGQLITGSE